MKQRNMKTTKWQRASKILILFLLLTAVIFYRDSLEEILRGILEADSAAVLTGILLSVAAYFVEGMTIACMSGAVIPSGIYAGEEEHAGQSGRQPGRGQLTVGQGTRIAFLCEFYRMITLGNGSGFAEIHYLHQSGIEAGSAAGLTMIQYMLKRAAVLLLGVFGFAALWGSSGTRQVCREYALFMAAGCGGTAVVIAVFTALAVSARIAAWAGLALDWLSRKLPSWEDRFAKWKEQVFLLNRSGRAFLDRKRRGVCALLLQTVKMLLFYAIPASLLLGEIRITFLESILLMAVAYMLSGIIPAPSGVGALEFVFLLFFSRFTDSGTALSAILIFRFAIWVLPFGIGGGLMVLGRKRGRSPGRDAAGAEAKDSGVQNRRHMI